MANSQILQAPILYVNNLSLQWASTTTLTLGFGQSRDFTNVTDGASFTTLTLNGGTVGVANGLDTGTLANNTWYYIYALIDSKLNNPIVSLISASPTLPTVPTAADGTGWDTRRLVGYVLTNSSAQFIKFYTVGTGTERELIWDANIPTAITAGSATVLTPVLLGVGVPPVQNTVAKLYVNHSPAAAGGFVSIAPGDSTATILPHVTGSVASQPNSGYVEVVSRLVTGVANAQYINSAGSGSTTIWVNGFKYFI